MFKENQAKRPLVVRVEHCQAINIFNKHRTFLGIEGRKGQVLETQKIVC